ncbi:hypothetical protein LguiA_002225 [Lonicera macranthoides]
MTTPPDDMKNNATHESSTLGGESVDAIRAIARELANMLGHIDQPQGRIQENRAMTALEKFKKLSPPTFDGMSSPNVAKSWLDQVERAFCNTPCSIFELIIFLSPMSENFYS